MRSFIALLVLLFLSCQASLGADITEFGVSWCAEEGLQANPNEAFCACAIIRNSGDCCQPVQVGFKAPAGWEVVSLGQEEILLNPGCQEFYAVTIRAAKNCRPGNYSIEVFLSVEDKIISEDTLWVHVAEYSEVLAEVQPYPALVPAGAPYQIGIHLPIGVTLAYLSTSSSIHLQNAFSRYRMNLKVSMKVDFSS